jgi:hypothetical protein
VWGVAGFLALYCRQIRDEGRWLIWSRDYKAHVLARPIPPNGELKNIEWDSCGMFAQDFDEFLVFDPTDSLATTQGCSPEKVNGIPCAEGAVRRLESRWYMITYPF